MSMLILRQVREAISNLNPADVREAAERPVTIRIAARNSAGYAAIEDFLAPRTVSRRKRYELTKLLYRSGDAGGPGHADLEIVEAGLDGNAGDGVFVFDPSRPSDLVAELLAVREELGLALSRSFPPFRGAVTKRVIHRVAWENTVFSLMTALPHLAPSMAPPFVLPESISDTAFLTVNQIRMAFLLAAASDRPVGYREQRTEVAALIAGAIGWRAIANRLGSYFDIGNGTVARAAVAYAGTHAVGASLERLYRTGYGLTRQERQLAYGDALARGRQVAQAVLNAWRERRAGRVYEAARPAALS